MTTSISRRDGNTTTTVTYHGDPPPPAQQEQDLEEAMARSAGDPPPPAQRGTAEVGERPSPPTTTSADDVQARQDQLDEMRRKELEQQRADIQGSFYTKLGLYQAGKETENVLMYLGEWQKTVNGDIEASARAQADGIPAPQVSTGVDNGFLFTNDAKDKEDNWDAIGNIIGNGSGG